MEKERALDERSSSLTENESEVDLFDNRRRRFLSAEGARRASSGLPDNGVGLTKDFYNIDRPMSVTSLVDLIVMRRAGYEDRPRKRSTSLSKDLEERIKKTLAWKEVEDELNKEDVMVNFRKKMRELRKEARQSIPKEIKIERKINEERRIQLRTTLLEPNNQRLSTTESIKEAIQEFRTRQPAIIEEHQEIDDYEEEDKEVTDIIQKTRELLQQMGYLNTANLQTNKEEEIKPTRLEIDSLSQSTSEYPENDSAKKRKKESQSESEKSINLNYKSSSAMSSTSRINSRNSDHQRRGHQKSFNQPTTSRAQGVPQSGSSGKSSANRPGPSRTAPSRSRSSSTSSTPNSKRKPPK